MARLYASIACESWPSISWICARTLCASARLPEIVGSAEAVFTDAKATATKIAVRSVRIAGALLERDRIRAASVRDRAAPRWGPGPSQVAHPSSPGGRLQRSAEPKTAFTIPASQSTNTRTLSMKLLRSALREGALDERRGAFRCRFHGSAAARLRPGRARGRRGRPAGPGSRPEGGFQLARRARHERHARALLAWGAAGSRPDGAGRDRCRAGGARPGAGVRPHAANGGEAGPERLADPARGARPGALPATRERSARRRARRGVARRGVDGAGRHQPRGGPEQPDRRAGARRTAPVRRPQHQARGAGAAARSAGRRGRGEGVRARGSHCEAAELRRRAAPAARLERRADRVDRGAGARRRGADGRDRCDGPGGPAAGAGRSGLGAPGAVQAGHADCDRHRLLDPRADRDRDPDRARAWSPSIRP